MTALQFNYKNLSVQIHFKTLITDRFTSVVATISRVICKHSVLSRFSVDGPACYPGSFSVASACKSKRLKNL